MERCHTQHDAWPVRPKPIAKLPPDSPEILSRYTIKVKDPKRTLACRTARKQASFQRLVNLYIVQLRHGCGDASCTKPTCYSCRKRISKAPVRGLNSTTARSVACYLASQPNAEAGLCDIDSVFGSSQRATGVPGRLREHQKLGNVANSVWYQTNKLTQLSQTTTMTSRTRLERRTRNLSCRICLIHPQLDCSIGT